MAHAYYSTELEFKPRIARLIKSTICLSFIEYFVIAPKLVNLIGFEVIEEAKRKVIAQLLIDFLGSGDIYIDLA